MDLNYDDEFISLLEDIDISQILFGDATDETNEELSMFSEDLQIDEVESTNQPQTLIHMNDQDFVFAVSSHGHNDSKVQELLQLKKKLCEKLALQENKVQQIEADHVEECFLENRADIIKGVEIRSQQYILKLQHIAEEFLWSKIQVQKPKNKHLPRQKRDTLFKWFTANIDHPYPKKQDKSQLAAETGLNEKQIDTWFTNMRLRHWKPLLRDRENNNKQLNV